MLRIFSFVFFSAFIFGNLTFAGENYKNFDENWEYQWPSDNWKSVKSLKEIPEKKNFSSLFLGKREKEELWLRKQLPKKNIENPHLYISNVFGRFSVLLEGEIIYQRLGNSYNEIEIYYPNYFHIIPLKSDMLGKTLIFNFYSENSPIGIKGDVIIGNREELIDKVKGDSWEFILVSIFFFFITFISFSWVVNKKENLYISFFLASLGGFFINLNFVPIKQLWISSPSFWAYVEHFSVILLIVGLSGFIWEFLKHLYFQWFRRSILLYGVISILLTPFVPFFMLRLSIDLFVIFSALYTIVLILVELFKKNKNLISLVFGFGVFIFFVLMDMARQLNFFDVGRPLGHWGHLLFSFFFFFYLYKNREKKI